MFSNNLSLFLNKKNTNNQIKREPMMPVELIMNDSLELALITCNISTQRFKVMTRNDLENYVKNLAYHSGFDNKKYLLSLNILLNEYDKHQANNIVNQVQMNKKQEYIEKNIYHQKIDNTTLYIEPEDFKLPNNIKQNNINENNFTIKQNSNIKENNIRQNKNLECSSYNGSIFGSIKTLNNNPSISFKPKNEFVKEIKFNENIKPNIQLKQSNNIINQGSFIQTSFNLNNKKRNSNLDVGNSNNYVFVE